MSRRKHVEAISRSPVIRSPQQPDPDSGERRYNANPDSGARAPARVAAGSAEAMAVEAMAAEAMAADATAADAMICQIGVVRVR